MYRHTNIQYRLVESLFRFKWRFLAILLTAIAITSFLVYSKMKTYVASVSLRVPGNSTLSKVLAESASLDYSSYTPPAKLHAGRFMDLLNDNKEGKDDKGNDVKGFMSRVLIRAGLRELISPLPQDDDKKYGKFVSNITTSEDSSEVFSIIVRWDDNKQAEQLVSALREEYVEWAGRTKVESTKKAYDVVQEKEGVEKGKLLGMAERIDNFGKINSQLMPGGLENDQALNARYNMELGNLQAEYKNTIASRLALEKARAKMPAFVTESKMQDANPSSVLTDGTEGGIGSVSSTHTLLLQAERIKKDLLRRGYLASSPDVIEQTKKIKELEEQTESEKKETRETPSERETQIRNPDLVFANTQIPNFKIDETNILSEIDLKKKQLIELRKKLKIYPGIIAKHDILKDEKEAQQKVVSDLRQKKKSLETQIVADEQTAKSQFENIGTVYAMKSVNAKNMAIFLLGGAFLGFVFGCIAVLASEISDPSLRYGEDVENGLNLPVLSVVPESRSFQGTELSPEFRWFKLDDLGK
jgi:uncharacterized protein involved in exopolysaccharide biosynthesis